MVVVVFVAAAVVTAAAAATDAVDDEVGVVDAAFLTSSPTPLFISSFICVVNVANLVTLALGVMLVDESDLSLSDFVWTLRSCSLIRICCFCWDFYYFS